MKFYLFVLLIIPTSLWSQSFIQDIEIINQHVGQKAMDDYLKTPTEDGVPGSVIHALMPAKGLDPDLDCEEEKKEPKNTHYEVIVVAEGAYQDSLVEKLPDIKPHLPAEGLKELWKLVPESDSAKGLTHEAITHRAQEIWDSKRLQTQGAQFDVKADLGRELFIEGLVHASAKSTLSEQDLSQELAEIIAKSYKTDEEKFNLLSALSNRLYLNYNTARNPGHDNKHNNPLDLPLPPADMTLNQLMSAAADNDRFGGGVCNDISEAVMMIGEQLFPEKDVLAISSGTHVGVVIADEHESRVIDGGQQLRMKDQLLLSPYLSPTNLRISKVMNGALKEIAVVDTQMGYLTEAAFQTGKSLLKTDANISTIMANYTNQKVTLTGGTGHLSDSEVLIIVAKYETASDKWKSHIGIGASSQEYHGDIKTKYQIHLRGGVERNFFRYVNSQTTINASTGIRVDGMYTLNPAESQTNVRIKDISGGMDLYHRLDGEHRSPHASGIKVTSSIEVEQSLGAKNWGNVTGEFSYMEPSDTGPVLKDLRFHLNQVNANVTTEKSINQNVSAVTRVHYQGSNIGQRVSILAGLNIKAPEGAQIIAFVGHTDAKLPGYKTKHSLLANPSGGEIGFKYKTKSGVEFGGALRGISSEPSVHATIKVPLGKPSR